MEFLFYCFHKHLIKKLLWIEYCEDCRMNGEDPLMYSQFCYYIQKDEEKRRATMHIPRKPGEQIKVDCVYYGKNVPLFRRNEYRKSGIMILQVRNRDTSLNRLLLASLLA